MIYGDIQFNNCLFCCIDFSLYGIFADRNAEILENQLLYRPDKTVLSLLSLCSSADWTEGVLICEREIARRGLNQQEPKERMAL